MTTSFLLPHQLQQIDNLLPIFNFLILPQIYLSVWTNKFNRVVVQPKAIYLLIKIPIKQAMSKKIHRDDSISQSKKSSLSKKSKRTQHSNSGKSKISIEKLSHALYHHEIKSKSNKVVLYDEFESEKQDIEGSMTSRYLPMETDGECLRRCQKIENLQDRQTSVAKKRCKEEGQRRMRDTRAKRKQNKKQINFQMMDCGDSFILTPLISVKDS